MVRRGIGVYKYRFKKIFLFKKTIFDYKILYLNVNVPLTSFIYRLLLVLKIYSICNVNY